jgi:hypothetical protein
MADRRRRIKQHNPILRRQERRLIRAVSHPIQVLLDTTDVVALLVQRRTQRRPRDRRVIRQILSPARASVRVCLSCRIWCAHGHIVNRRASDRILEFLSPRPECRPRSGYEDDQPSPGALGDRPFAGPWRCRRAPAVTQERPRARQPAAACLLRRRSRGHYASKTRVRGSRPQRVG